MVPPHTYFFLPSVPPHWQFSILAYTVPLNIVQNFHAIIGQLLYGISVQVEQTEVGESGEVEDLLHVVDDVVLQADRVEEVVVPQTRQSADLIPRQVQFPQHEKSLEILDLGDPIALEEEKNDRDDE